MAWFVKAADAKEHIAQNEFFTILRHPSTRFVSDLNWHIVNKPKFIQSMIGRQVDGEERYNLFASKVLDALELQYPSYRSKIAFGVNSRLPFKIVRMHQKALRFFSSFIHAGRGHFLPQVEFLRFGGQPFIQYVLTFENLKDDFEQFSQIFDLDYHNIKRNTSSLNYPLNPSINDRLKEFYQADFAAWEKAFNSQTIHFFDDIGMHF